MKKWIAPIVIALMAVTTALACTGGGTDGEGSVVNPTLPPDCIEVSIGNIPNPFARKRPTAADHIDLRDPEYIAVRVYQRVNGNTMKFLGWSVRHISDVKWLHDPKNL